MNSTQLKMTLIPTNHGDYYVIAPDLDSAITKLQQKFDDLNVSVTIDRAKAKFISAEFIDDESNCNQKLVL